MFSWKWNIDQDGTGERTFASFFLSYVQLLVNVETDGPAPQDRASFTIKLGLMFNGARVDDDRARYEAVGNTSIQ
jgi:hypothetical protein